MGTTQTDESPTWERAWLADVLRRELTPLEAKIAEWSQRCFRGLYHLDPGNAWPRWMRQPSDSTHEVTTITAVGTPGYGNAWGNLAAWVEVAHDVGLEFSLRSAGPHRIAVRFWHTRKRPA